MSEIPASPPPIPPAPKPSSAQAYLLFGIVFLLLLVVGVPLQLWSMPAGLALTEMLVILLPAVLYARMKRLPVAGALGWRPVSPGLALRSVVLGVSAWGAAILVYKASTAALGPLIGPDPTDAALGILVPETWKGLPLTLLVAALLPGICEESLFRGAIQGTLQRKGPWKAILIAAGLFAAFHMSPWNFLSAFALGTLFGTMVLRTHSIVPAMIAHACVNATAFTAGFFLKGGTGAISPWFLASSAVILLAALAEFIYRTRRAERAPSPLASAPAGLLPRGKRRALWAAATAAMVLVALIGTARTFLNAYEMKTDDLSPEVRRGDHVMTLKERWARSDLKPGDVIAFKRDDKTFLRKVARTDTTTVWVIEKQADTTSSETAVPRSDVLGRMLFKVSTGGANR